MYAIEIILTRAVGAVELKAARQASSLPMASSANGRRLVVLVSAKREKRAIQRIWKRLDDALPVDVLGSLFPAPDGSYLMSIPLTETVWNGMRSRAAAGGKTPEEYLRDVVAQALARDQSKRRARLECRLDELMRAFTAEEITAEAAQRLKRT
ncbi:hypothetical protein [Streptomyces sp. CC219B]|uniref:hypothetical protein n=1 Tax=Streptomyces sp. CC219B TaxID=3044574 RepID=UPI0024A97DBD|nr:hypothetical protein [Streptomyces sp. CC219B]